MIISISWRLIKWDLIIRFAILFKEINMFNEIYINYSKKKNNKWLLYKPVLGFTNGDYCNLLFIGSISNWTVLL
jgi:hypothetical protein